MFFDPSGIPFMSPDDDFTRCADELSETYQGEFSLCESLSPETVSASILAGFLPMGAAFGEGQGRLSLLMPKLHSLRCLLPPEETRFTRTVRRESARYSMTLNARFREVTSLCTEIHGEGWLIPELADTFVRMHEERESMPIRMISVELFGKNGLAAGEIGYLAGGSYTSLSGFFLVPGAGSVQLAALGMLLARSGISVWDLGMPEPEYKTRLGGTALPRNVWIKTVRQAYGMRQCPELAREFGIPNLRELLTGGLP